MTQSYNARIEALRASEYGNMRGCVYLDCAGSTIPAASMIEAHARDLITNLYGNPHSNSDPAVLAGSRVDDIRHRALRFFNADPQHFDLIFTLNSTHAIKTVYECFKDFAARAPDQDKSQGFWLGYHRDAHTSLVGGRELAGPDHRCFKDDAEVEKWLSKDDEEASATNGRIGLFAYPGQSNMTGRRLPKTWPGKLRSSRMGKNTFTLFDAAALSSTAPLDLSDPSTAPDFTVLSFYKIFGYPDVGALIVRKQSAHLLTKRQYFGGGTVDMVVSVGEPMHFRKDFTKHPRYELHDQLEDGTLPFHAILALDAAMDTHQRLFGSMKDVSRYTSGLTARMYQGLCALKHGNGRRIVKIYNDSSATYGDAQTQGATIAFNVFDANGTLIPPDEVEKFANTQKIFLRSGGLCNPGGIFTHLALQPEEMKTAYLQGHKCGRMFNGKPTGVVRASLGAMSTEADVDSFLAFVHDGFVDECSNTQIEVRPTTIEATPDIVFRNEIKAFEGVISVRERRQQESDTSSERMKPRKLSFRKGWVYLREIRFRPKLRSSMSQVEVGRYN